MRISNDSHVGIFNHAFIFSNRIVVCIERKREKLNEGSRVRFAGGLYGGSELY